MPATDNNASNMNSHTGAMEKKSGDGNMCEAITVEEKTSACNMKPNTAVDQRSTSGTEEIMNVTIEATKLTKN